MTSTVEFDIDIADIEAAQKAVQKQEMLNYANNRIDCHILLKEYSKINVMVKNTIDNIDTLDPDIIKSIIKKITKIKDQVPLYKCLIDVFEGK